MEMKGKNPEFLSELYLVCIFECICHALYIKNNRKSDDFYYFFRLRQETDKKENINSSFFSSLLCSC